MWLHIRAVGEWTNRLYDYFEAEQEKLHNGEIPPLTDHTAHNQATIVQDNTIKRIQTQLQRKFSGREKNGQDSNAGEARLVGFSRGREVNTVSASDGEINNRATSSNGKLVIFQKLFIFKR